MKNVGGFRNKRISPLIPIIYQEKFGQGTSGGTPGISTGKLLSLLPLCQSSHLRTAGSHPRSGCPFVRDKNKCLELKGREYHPILLSSQELSYKESSNYKCVPVGSMKSPRWANKNGCNWLLGIGDSFLRPGGVATIRIGEAAVQRSHTLPF